MVYVLKCEKERIFPLNNELTEKSCLMLSYFAYERTPNERYLLSSPDLIRVILPFSSHLVTTTGLHKVDVCLKYELLRAFSKEILKQRLNKVDICLILSILVT